MKKIVLFDIDYTLFDTDNFKKTNLKEYTLYKETVNVLSKISKISELGIFSQGGNDFQKEKLNKTNIHKFFSGENIHIFEEKEINLNNVLLKYKDSKIILIDDKLGILHMAKKLLPSVCTVWVKRGIYAQNQKDIKDFSPDIKVTDLRDIIPFIENC